MVKMILSFEGLQSEEIGTILRGANDRDGCYQPEVAIKIIREATKEEYLEFCKKSLVTKPPYTFECRFYEVEVLD